MTPAIAWQFQMQTVQSQANSMALNASGWAAELITNVSRRVCEQPVPQDEIEGRIRRQQCIATCGLIFAIRSADDMTDFRPVAVEQVREAAKQFCDVQLPRLQEEFKDLQARTLEFMGMVTLICT